MSETNYFINNGTLYKATADVDELQDNPRTEWDGWYSHMNIYLRDYAFGDNDGGEREDDLRMFVENHFSTDDIIKKAFDGKFSTKYERIINKDGEHVVKATRDNGFDYEIDDDENMIIDDIFDEFAFQDLWNLCQNHPDFVALPIYAYIHSGITISTGSYGDPWDSGWAGYIYVTREEAEKNGIEWNKGEMIKLLESEVKITKQWLTGEVYWIGIQKYDIEDGWDDYESCGGYFSDKYGDELFGEMIEDLVGFKVDTYYYEDDDEVQAFYKQTEEFETSRENKRIELLKYFNDVAAHIYDKYKIQPDDLIELMMFT